MNSIIVSTDHSHSFNKNIQFSVDRPDLNLYSNILKLAPFTWLVDRTKSCNLPFKTHFIEDYQLPEIIKHSCDSLNNICQNTAEQYKNIDKQIYILWSGGIDSTLLVVSFLKSTVPYSKITIACNFDSIKENYDFYKKHILPNFKIISSDFLMQSVNTSTTDGIILNGDPADVLYGYDLTTSISKTLGFDYLQLPCNRDNVTNYFKIKGFSEQSANFWYDYFTHSIDKSPKPIKTMQDFSWWEGFNYRWQAANEKFYIRLSLNNTNCYERFFNHHEFQLWAIFKEPIIIKKFNDIKLESKKIILDYTKDEFYFYNKIKLNSNSHVFGLNSYSAVLNNGQRLTADEFNVFDFYDENNFINDWLSV